MEKGTISETLGSWFQ